MEAIFEPKQRNIVSHYHFLSGWCQLLRDQTSQADSHTEKAVNLAVETGALFPEIVCRFLMARVLHKKGQYEEALVQLANVKDLVERHECRVFEYHLSLMEAQFAMDRGEEERCIQALGQGLAFGRKLGLKTMLFIWQPSEMARLCALALEKEIEVDYVRELIRIFRLPPGNISHGIEHWPWPLKIYTLGRFGILKDGKPIRFSKKGQEKPISMLKVLIALGGREVREEDLLDFLWPEAEGDAAHNSFETTLHRLRTLIGYPEALQLYDGRLTLDSRYCWVDTWAFERLLREVDGKEWTEDSIPLTQKAIGMYRGSFLAKEIEHPWLISIRERLRSKFLRSVNRLGNHWCQTKQWGKALECYQKGIEVDDLAEEFCQGLMTCYQNLGLEANALSQYNRFGKRLKAVLGIEPSPKTKSLRDALLKKSQSA
jgi:DNA-binding SARP family transcriptional activator